MSAEHSNPRLARLRFVLFDLLRVLITLSMVAIAAGAVWWARGQQQAHPWTRDGQVLADLVQVAPRVSGLVARVHVSDNQEVAAGDPLFDIDAELFQQALDEARADLGQALAEADNAEAEARRARALHASGDISDEDLDVRQAQRKTTSAAVDAARAALAEARLKLGYTKVTAPVNGFVTNLSLLPGAYAKAGAAQVALIDAESFWVAGYFKETDLRAIRRGDPAAVVLMSHPDRTLHGRVESIAYGIARRNAARGSGDLARVAPTFEWIRLAQRIPVRIELTDKPADVPLRIGYTASVSVNPSGRGTGSGTDTGGG